MDYFTCILTVFILPNGSIKLEVLTIAILPEKIFNIGEMTKTIIFFLIFEIREIDYKNNSFSLLKFK